MMAVNNKGVWPSIAIWLLAVLAVWWRLVELVEGGAWVDVSLQETCSPYITPLKPPLVTSNHVSTANS
jgi:hypothetical protein